MSHKKGKKNHSEETNNLVKAPARDFYDASRGIHRVIPCLFLALAVLIGFFLVLNLSGTNDSVLGRGIVWLFAGLFSDAMYAIPFLLLWQGFRWHSDVEKKRAISRIVYFFLFLMMAGAIRFCFSEERTLPFVFTQLFRSGVEGTGAGLIGGLVGTLLYRLTGYIGVPFFTAVIVLLFFSHFLGLTPHALLQHHRERKAEREAEKSIRQAAVPPPEDEITIDEDTSPREENAPIAENLEAETTTPLSPHVNEKRKTVHQNELSENEKGDRIMTAKEKKALKKEKKAKKKEIPDDGYYPADMEESFEQIRQRLEEEALTIERQALSSPVVPTWDAPDLPSEVSQNQESSSETPQSTSDSTSISDGAIRADAVFSQFDPLAANALINTAPPVLRPNVSEGAIRRETIRPLRPENKIDKTTIRPIPGGVQSENEQIGSYRINAKHLEIPTTRNPRPQATPSAIPQIEEEPTPEEKTLSSFEEITTRTEPETVPSSLPFVHPATQPSTQAPVSQTNAENGITFPQTSPTATVQTPYYNPYPPYPGNPYMQPYPPMNGYAPAGQAPNVPPYIPGQPYVAYPYAPAVPLQGQPVPQGATVGVPQPTPAAPIAQQPTFPDETPYATERVVESALAESDIVRNTQAKSDTPSQQPTAVSDAPRKQSGPNYDNYLFPPLSLLTRSVPITNANGANEVDEMSARVVTEFQKFKHAVEVREVTVGPRITRYSISPPDGVRINTLTNLANDIALGLAVKSIRINPVPDTPYLGIEIPNRSPATVRLSSLINTEEFRHTKTVTTVPLGADITGAPVFADLAKMPHLLVAGATGMGKSVLINSILMSLLYKAKPDQVKLILVDPKRVEMSVYSGIPHLLVPPVVEPQKAAGALIWAVGEMERRYNLMQNVSARNIEGYNEVVKNDPSRGEVQPKIIIVIDELNDLMMQARDAVEPAIMSIAQKARAAGIHLIIGTQRPSVDVITGVIKANIPSRIALHVSSGTDSRTILDTVGAEKLLDKGDMLAVISGAEPIRVQSAFVSDDEVENVTSFLRKNCGGAIYDEIISAQIDSETEKYKNSGKRASERFDDDMETDASVFEDSVFMSACKIALESGKISTSLLQRRCSIGYGKAAKYIDIMESMGIVSAPDGQKPREVLMSNDQFMEMVSRETYSGD